MSTTISETTITHDEAQIREIIAEWSSAFCSKDIDRLMALYATDAVMFDVKPPYQLKGKQAFRDMLEACLPCFPDSFHTETRDLRIVAGSEVAFSHWLTRFAGLEGGHPASQSWFRATACYRKHRGRWQIVHDHVSVPFDPQTSQAAFTTEP